MVEVSKEDRIAARREFMQEARPAYLKDTAAKYPEELQKMGIDAAGVEAMKAGKMPKGFEVHCVVPIAEGGSVKPFNLVLIKQDEHHKAHTEAAPQANVEDRKALRAEFMAGKRQAFLKDLAEKDADGLKAMGVDEAGIASMKEGKTPKNFTVHHKVPLSAGGTNSFLNMAFVSLEEHQEHHKVADRKPEKAKAAYPEMEGTDAEKETLKKCLDEMAKTAAGKELIDNATAAGFVFVCDKSLPEVGAYTDFEAKVCGFNPDNADMAGRLSANLKAIRNEPAVLGEGDAAIDMLHMLEFVEERQLKKALQAGYKFGFGETPAPAHGYTDTEKKVVCISDKLPAKERQEALKKQVARASGELDSKYVYATRKGQGR